MLTYEAELNLLRSILSQFNLKVTLLIAEKEEITKSDLGLRSRIYGVKLPESLEETLNKNFKDKVVNQIRKEEQQRLTKEGNIAALNSIKKSNNILVSNHQT